MTRTETSTVFAEAITLIERAVPDVFSFISDPENERRWHDDILLVRRPPGADAEGVPKDSYDQGSQWTWIARFMGREAEGTVEVTAVEPNRCIEFTTRTGPVLPIATCLLEPANGGTLFTRRVEIPLQGTYVLAKPSAAENGDQGPAGVCHQPQEHP